MGAPLAEPHSSIQEFRPRLGCTASRTTRGVREHVFLPVDVDDRAGAAALLRQAPKNVSISAVVVTLTTAGEIVR